MTSSTAAASAGSGSSPVSVSAFITPAGTTTYYQLVATNLGGTTNGQVRTEVCT
jgi:hypothetical protein